MAQNPLPAVIGTYEILDRIADGSMSTVYKGRNQATGEIVAIKIFAADLAVNPVLLKRFMQEIRTARSLDHPHIVRGLDFGIEDNILYLVMEFVEGESLGDRLEKQGKLPEADAVRIVVQIAQALHEAHQRGYIHRDAKPDNILLTTDNQAKLTDLGLVKDLGANLELTKPAKGLGTPNFMAPEQFDNAKNADARCDIYTLGATLYMCVTGVLPFQAKTTPAVWKKKMNNELTPPRQLVPGLSERVERTILKALSVDPARRHASCAEFVEKLTGAPMPRPVSPEAPVRPAVVAPLPPPTKKLDPADRRVKVRFPSNLDGVCSPIGDEDQLSWSGKIKDISASGVGLLLSRRFEPLTILNVDVKGKSRTTTHTLLVRVVRVIKQGAKKWQIGCEFARTLTDDEVQDLL